MAIRTFADSASEDISYERNTKRPRSCLPIELHNKARIKLARVAAAASLEDLSTLPGNRFEALKGDRFGQYSIRINDQYRICFSWKGNNACDVEIVDYH
ncbi:MAG: type II toxin-antitoxin system RelE/ParE family toxin [Pyrinomonadaceae bacterium]